MFSFKLPSDQEIVAFQEAALADLVARWKEEFAGELTGGFRVENDGSPEDRSITTVVPSSEFKLIVSGPSPYDYTVFLWVYIGSYDGSGSYGEWYTKIDGAWVSTEDTNDFDGSNGTPSWEV